MTTQQLITMAYVCLVVVGALLWLVPMERLAVIIWQQRGMEVECTKVVQAQQAKIDDLADRLEMRDGEIKAYQELVGTRDDEIRRLNNVVGGLKIDMDRIRRGLPPRGEVST